MIRPSKKTQLRIASAVSTALTSAIATRLITDKRIAPLLVGVAVLATHTSSVVGDAAVGNVVSRARKEARGQSEDIAEIRNEIKLLNGNREKARPSQEGDSDEDEFRPSLPTENPPQVITKHVPEEPLAAADPKNRRSGEPPRFQVSSQLIKGRTDAPIVGEAASEWIKSRTSARFCPPTETTPSYRLGSLPLAADIRVAMIADDFTFHSYAPEFNIRRLTPQNWRQLFEEHKPQLFFCESAWQGGDPKSRPWQGKIYASVRWPRENRKVLLEILDHCHKVGIPTVFWNKEDPTHFGDRVNDFIRTAALFDHVFTTAEECVPSYRRDADIQNIDVLPFAVQPRLFNPQGIRSAADSVNFAGTWYRKYPERCESAASIMDQVLEANLDLVIYDRMYSSPQADYRYPDRYAKYTKPTIPYTEIPASYKKSKFGITLNTVKDSKTMFARRAFELAASGAVVLSNFAVGVNSFFGDSVLYPDRDNGVLLDLDEKDYLDLQQRAMDVSLDHTYAHRAEQILRAVGIEYQPHIMRPTAMAFVRSEAEYDVALKNFRANSGVKDLLAVATEDQEQSLEMRLMMRRDCGVTVMNASSLRHQEFRVRNYLSSPGIIVGGEEKSWPESAIIDRLMAHSSHFDGAVKAASDATDRYKMASLEDASGAYIPADFVGNFFAGIGEVPLFQV